MFKVFTVFTGTILIIVTREVLAEEMMTLPMSLLLETIEPYAMECEPNPERVHAEELFLNKEDAHPITKCLRRCLMDQFELFAEDSTDVNTEKLVSWMVLLYSEKMDELKELSNGCNEKTIEMGIIDKCEVAHSFAMCMLKEMREREYEIPEVEQ
uniref:Odorant-binding protein 19b n=1 Tax=Bactrocera minax TaxID=104690 RepID=A0A3G2LEF1_9MUSC|nr:odorant-binding protein 19b [Bactrocera minax]